MPLSRDAAAAEADLAVFVAAACTFTCASRAAPAGDAAATVVCARVECAGVSASSSTLDCRLLVDGDRRARFLAGCALEGEVTSLDFSGVVFAAGAGVSICVGSADGACTAADIRSHVLGCVSEESDRVLFLNVASFGEENCGHCNLCTL